MSFVDSYRRSVAQKQKNIADLSSGKAREQTKLADLNKRVVSASEAARRAANPSTLKSKMNEIERYQKYVAGVTKKIADFEEKIARKYKELHAEQAKLTREEQKEQEKSRRAHLQAMQAISSEMNVIAQDQMYTHHEIEKLKAIPKSITVLFLAANPITQQPLRIDEEARAIQEKIRLSEFRDVVKFETRWAVRPLDMLQAINEYKPAIIHFSGHGAQNGEIVLQDVNGREKFVSIPAIAHTLKTASEDIRFMFFNTCFSQGQAEAAVEYVEGAIGMNSTIGDHSAMIFATQFYSAIAFGKSVAIAFEQAKAALMLENIPEEDTPELFLQEGIDAEKFILVKPA